MRPMSVRFPKRTSILNAVQKRADCKQVSKGEKMETSEDKQENGPTGNAESTESEQLSDSPTRGERCAGTPEAGAPGPSQMVPLGNR